MHATRIMGPKGQIVVPKSVREQLGLKRGSKLIFEVDEEKAIKIVPLQDAEDFVEKFCSAVEKKLAKKIDLDTLYEKQIAGRNTP